jgi:hypothetical protein
MICRRNIANNVNLNKPCTYSIRYYEMEFNTVIKLDYDKIQNHRQYRKNRFEMFKHLYFYFNVSIFYLILS